MSSRANARLPAGTNTCYSWKHKDPQPRAKEIGHSNHNRWIIHAIMAKVDALLETSSQPQEE